MLTKPRIVFFPYSDIDSFITLLKEYLAEFFISVSISLTCPDNFKMASGKALLLERLTRAAANYFRADEEGQHTAET